jgi:hypothetical protein
MRPTLAILAALIPGVLPAQGPLADYGDAPDVPYPSKFARGGVHHLDTTQEWLGGGAISTTTRENDSLQGGDADDGGGVFFTAPGLNLFSIGAAYDPTRSNVLDARYLNVLVDIDGDGKFEGGTEWPIQNFVVDFTGLPVGVTAMTLVVQINPLALLPLWTGRQVRATLTTDLIGDGTGKWGAHARGETEDFPAVVVPLPPGKVSGVKTLVPEFRIVRPIVRHGVVHAQDGGNPDAFVDVTMPAVAIGKAITLRVRWRRVGDATPGNPYRGSLAPIAGGGPVVPLPANSDWSPKYEFKAGLAPAKVAIPIDGSFPNPLADGDTHTTFKIKVWFDPPGEYVLFSNEASEVAPPPPGDPTDPVVDGWFAVRGACGDGWSAPQHDPFLSSAGQEYSVALALRGTQAVVSSDRSGTGRVELFLASRPSRQAAWSTPVRSSLSNLANVVWFADLSEDGTEIAFQATSATNQGGDLWLCRRTNVLADFDWRQAVPLQGLNTASDEGDPSFGRDGLTLYFQSDRPGGDGNAIWRATRPNRASLFANPELVVDHPGLDHSPAISHSGHALAYSRHLGGSNSEVFVRQRPEQGGPFATPTPIESLQSSGWEANGQFESADAEFWFVSDAFGGGASSSVYVTRRNLPALACDVDSVPAATGGAVTLLCDFFGPGSQPFEGHVYLLAPLRATVPLALPIPGLCGHLELDPLTLFALTSVPSVGGESSLALAVPAGVPPGGIVWFQVVTLASLRLSTIDCLSFR